MKARAGSMRPQQQRHWWIYFSTPGCERQRREQTGGSPSPRQPPNCIYRCWRGNARSGDWLWEELWEKSTVDGNCLQQTSYYIKCNCESHVGVELGSLNFRYWVHLFLSRLCTSCFIPFVSSDQITAVTVGAASTWRPWVSGLVGHFVQTWPDSELLSHSAVLRL